MTEATPVTRTDLQVTGAVGVLARRAWPGSAITVAADGQWMAVALPGRVVVARLPNLDMEREIHVADVRSLVAIGNDRLALAPRRGLLIIENPAGTSRVAVRVRGATRVALAAGPGGILAAVGDRAALPRATVVIRTDLGRHRGWTAVVEGATAAAWMSDRDLVVAAGHDLVLVRDGVEDARVSNPLGSPITALAAVPGGVVMAGGGEEAVVHVIAPHRERPSFEVPPGGGRGLHATGGLLTVGTRSLGERVVVHALDDLRVVASLRGVAHAASAGNHVVATGREGTVVIEVEEDDVS